MSRIMNPRLSPAKLPEYDAPPAVETLMGMHFARLAGWNILHLGQIYDHFKTLYPHAVLVPPVVEPRDLAQGTINPEDLPIRAIFTNSENTELVQVQPSLFLRNWKRSRQTEAYTHYRILKPRFQEDWNKFTGFLRENSLRYPQVIQCEVTYVNHLLRGRDWESYNDLAKLIKLIAPRTPISTSGRLYKFLPEAAAVSLNVGYHLSDTGVSLQISIPSAISKPDGSEVIQMAVTAKAAPRLNTEEAFWEAIDCCHDAVILGFDDVITEDAQRTWGKR